MQALHASANHNTACQLSVRALDHPAEAALIELGAVRGLSKVVARVEGSKGAGAHDHTTERWQDKSRNVRGGRAAEENKQIRQLARGAFLHHSLRVWPTCWKAKTSRASPAEA